MRSCVCWDKIDATSLGLSNMFPTYFRYSSYVCGSVAFHILYKTICDPAPSTTRRLYGHSLCVPSQVKPTFFLPNPQSTSRARTLDRSCSLRAASNQPVPISPNLAFTESGRLCSWLTISSTQQPSPPEFGIYHLNKSPKVGARSVHVFWFRNPHDRSVGDH